MQALDERSLERALHAQGFVTTYIWQDGPGAKYGDHVHETETAHIILAGEMTLTMDGRAHVSCRRAVRCPGRSGAFSPNGAERLPLHDRREVTKAVPSDESQMTGKSGEPSRPTRGL